MNTSFDTIINRRNSDSIKWNRYPENVLPLWVADTDFPAPSPILAAINERLDHGLFGYSKRQDETRIAVCDWLSRRHDWTVSPEEVLLFPEVVSAFNIASLAFTNPGDSVLLQTPAYHPFLDLPSNVGLQASQHALIPDAAGRYHLDLDAFERSISPSTRIFMLCNPHNPTGRVFDKQELSDLARICLERKIIICSDEIHSDLIFQPHRHLPIASIAEEIAQRTVTLISPSKTFNLAGLKSSALVIKNKQLRDSFVRQSRGITGNVNVMGETALKAAYTDCDQWLGELLQYLTANRDMLYEFINQELPGISMALPEGTFLGWLDFTKTEIDAPGEFLLNRALVALNEGSWFGSSYAKFARINFGCPQATLLEALGRIKSALIST